MLLGAEPDLSTDCYRYLWEGKVQVAGFNPYQYAPADAALASLRDATWERVNHPEIPAIYGPLMQILFAFVALVGGGLLTLKALLVSADLALGGLILLGLLRRGASPLWLVVYAWHPLLILEGEKAPAVLENRIVELLEDVGYTTPPEDQAAWYRSDSELKTARLDDSTRDLPSSLVYHYRQSPEVLDLTGVTFSMTDPAPVLPGMIAVRMGATGRLLELNAIHTSARGEMRMPIAKIAIPSVRTTVERRSAWLKGRSARSTAFWIPTSVQASSARAPEAKR